MSDRYVFRGICKESPIVEHNRHLPIGEWVYGGICQGNEGALIRNDEYDILDRKGAYPVIQDTIGQCTGMPDKNGKLILEGDIVSDGTHKATVIWAQGCWYLRFPDDTFIDADFAALATCALEHFEIVGTIHD